MRLVATACVLFLCSLGVSHAQQISEPATQVIIPGSVRTPTGSPVEVSDAEYTLLRLRTEPGGFQLVAEAVKIRNVSGRAIRRLILRFLHNHLDRSADLCRGSTTGIIAVDELAAGETRDFTNGGIKMTWFAGKNDLALTVVVAGAEFEDGSNWAAPRRELCPLTRDCLSQRASYLMSRQCSLTDDSYSILLEVADARIVAYRLAMLSDTADSFEVRTGDWIELTEAQRVRGVRFVDAGKSLNSKLLFPRQAYVSILVNGKQATTFAGVAIFVAELRFADGRIWRQDTSREALIWDN